jgi:hypothetical protein
MTRFTMLLAAGLIALSGFMVTLIRIRPYDNSALNNLLPPLETCVPPCWMGIEPGVTRVDEAREILANHPWTTGVTVVGALEVKTGAGAIMWQWNGQQPFEVVPGFGGSITVAGGVVNHIRLRADVSYSDVWLAFGNPHGGQIECGQYSYHTYNAFYPERGLSTLTTIAAPMRLATFWGNPVEILLREDSATIASIPNWRTTCS